MGNLNVQNFQHTPPRFEAGPFPVAKSVKEAGVNIPARAPVILDETGKLALVTATAAEGDVTVNAEGLYGVTPEAIEAGKTGVVYLTGEFFGDSLTLPEGVNPTDVEVPLRKLGIFLK